MEVEVLLQNGIARSGVYKIGIIMVCLSNAWGVGLGIL